MIYFSPNDEQDYNSGRYERQSVVVILINAAGELLLQHRDDIPGINYPGFWAFFAGGLEAEEQTFEACAIREMEEELNLRLDPEDLTLYARLIDHPNPGRIGPGRDLHHIFKANITQTLEELTLNEGQDMGFFSKEKALDLRLAPWARDLISAF